MGKKTKIKEKEPCSMIVIRATSIPSLCSNSCLRAVKLAEGLLRVSHFTPPLRRFLAQWHEVMLSRDPECQRLILWLPRVRFIWTTPLLISRITFGESRIDNPHFGSTTDKMLPFPWKYHWSLISMTPFENYNDWMERMSKLVHWWHVMMGKGGWYLSSGFCY